jgi:hypothetical protein
MPHIKVIIGLVIFVLGFISENACVAGEAIKVLKTDGELTVSNIADSKQKTVQIQDTLPPGNILTTGANGRAVVRVGSTGIIVMEKNSRVEINTTNDHAGFFRQLTGKIYYAVNTLNKNDHALEIRIKTATMGVRGTRFLVTDTPERNDVGMRKGTLSVASPSDEFEIHKQSEQDEFEALKRETQAAITEEKHQFEEYKENTQREFIEFKHEFALGKDRMVSFDGKRVDDRPLSGETKKDMETLEGYAEKWLTEVQD